MKIPSIVYLIVGIVIAGVSFYINMQTESSKLFVFILIGICMAIYGVIMLVIGMKKGKESGNMANSWNPGNQEMHQTAQQGMNPHHQGFYGGHSHPAHAVHQQQSHAVNNQQPNSASLHQLHSSNQLNPSYPYHHHLQQQQHLSQKSAANPVSVKYCNRCGTGVSVHARYCTACANATFHRR